MVALPSFKQSILHFDFELFFYNELPALTEKLNYMRPLHNYGIPSAAKFC